jgi:hypothetical protein
MNKHSFTPLIATSLKRLVGLVAVTIGVATLASVASFAYAAPHQSHGGGLASHRGGSVSFSSRGHGGYSGHSSYRGHNYYGGYGWRGHGYRSYGWGGWGGFYSGLSLGLALPLVSNGYVSSWYGGSPYYYADDVYYVSNPRRGYRVLSPSETVITENYVYESPSPAPVVAAPPTSVAPTPSYMRETPSTVTKAPAAASAQLYAYPKNGQTATQSTFDRIECERWGSGQTGYAPGQSADDSPRKGDYQRAVSACLEGRGYSVR